MLTTQPQRIAQASADALSKACEATLSFASSTTQVNATTALRNETSATEKQMPTETTLTNKTTRTDYNTKETAQLIRAALKTSFPGVKFSVRTSYASMTSSTHVQWTDGPTEPEVELVTNRFTSRGFDGMTDSTTYHNQTLDGKLVHFSGWVTLRRDMSATLMQKALDRYNVERAEFGAERVNVVVSTNAWGNAQLNGSDLNRINVCGGSAVWVSDAIYQFAYKMRANGVIVNVKGGR